MALMAKPKEHNESQDLMKRVREHNETHGLTVKFLCPLSRPMRVSHGSHGQITIRKENENISKFIK